MPVDDQAVGTKYFTAAVAAEREEAFRAFVAFHRERAIRLAWQYLGGDDTAAEDVAQEAFAKAYQRLDDFRGDSKLDTWFYRILIRQAQNYRRWRSVRDLWRRKEGERASDISIGDNLGDPGLRQRITRALDRLSQPQKEVFILVYLEGFTIQECAEVLGKPSGTISSHLHRARTTLRKELADVYAGMEDS